MCYVLDVVRFEKDVGIHELIVEALSRLQEADFNVVGVHLEVVVFEFDYIRDESSCDLPSLFGVVHDCFYIRLSEIYYRFIARFRNLF